MGCIVFHPKATITEDVIGDNVEQTCVLASCAADGTYIIIIITVVVITSRIKSVSRSEKFLERRTKLINYEIVKLYDCI